MEGDRKYGRGEETSLPKKTYKALIWAGIESWGGQFVSIATYIVLASLLGPADFGLIAMAGNAIASHTRFDRRSSSKRRNNSVAPG